MSVQSVVCLWMLHLEYARILFNFYLSKWLRFYSALDTLTSKLCLIHPFLHTLVLCCLFYIYILVSFLHTLSYRAHWGNECFVCAIL